MPQISSSLHQTTIDAIIKIAKEDKRSFSETVNRLLESHPRLIEKLNPKK